MKGRVLGHLSAAALLSILGIRSVQAARRQNKSTPMPMPMPMPTSTSSFVSSATRLRVRPRTSILGSKSASSSLHQIEERVPPSYSTRRSGPVLPAWSGLSSRRKRTQSGPLVLRSSRQDSCYESIIDGNKEELGSKIINTTAFNQIELPGTDEGYDLERDDPIDYSTAEEQAQPFRVWGLPLQSVILLNLVAVIFGTQHAVIKSVVDDSTVGLGSNFAHWVESSLGLDIGGTIQDDSAAAYFTLARFGMAALLASPYTPGLRQMFSPKSESYQEENESVKLAWRYGAELGLFMFLGYAFQAVGLETTSASRSGFFLYLNVKFVPFFSAFLFGKRVELSTWISALVAFAGTGLLAFDNASNGSAGTLSIGDLWSIAAAAASAMFILRMEAASKNVTLSSELNAATLWTVVFLSSAWTIWASASYDSFEITQGFPSVFADSAKQTIATIIRHPLPLIYLGSVTTALANLIQSKAQKDVSAERAAVIYAMDPVYGAAFSNLLLGESLGGYGIVGALFIVVAAATSAIFDGRDDDGDLKDNNI